MTRKYIFIALIFLFYPISPAFAGDRIAVAVMPFRGINAPDDYAYLTDALPEVIAAQLQKVPQIQVITRTYMSGLLKEQAFADSGFVDPNQASRMGKLIAAEYVLTGTYQVVSGQVSVNTQLLGVDSGQVKYAEQKSYPLKNALSLQTEVAQGLSQSLSLKLDPEVQKALSVLAVKSELAVKQYLLGQQALKNKKYQVAKQYFYQAIEEEKSFLEAHQGYQIASEGLDNYANELNTYQKWLKESPDISILWNYLGNVHQSRKEWQAAEHAYMQVIIKNRNFALAYNNLGVLLMQSGREQLEAKNWFEKALRLNQLEPLTWYNLGKWHYEQNEHQKGQACFRKALELSNGEYLEEIQDALFGGELKIEARQLKLPGGQTVGEVQASRQGKESITLFRIYDSLGGFSPVERAQIVSSRIKKDLFALTPDNITAGIMNNETVVQTNENALIITVGAKAADRVQMKRGELAKDWSKKLSYMLAYEGMPFRTRGNPNDPEEIQWLQKGDELYSQGQIDQSIQAYSKSIQIRPDLYTAHYNLGKIYQEIGEYAKAESSFEAIIRRNPNYVEAHVALGELYIRTAQYDWAKKYLLRALELNPTHVQANGLLKGLKQ